MQGMQGMQGMQARNYYHGGAPGSMLNLPNQTLYISNLNDKISKELLRRELYVICSQFGNVLDVVALKTPKMRGQAHIVFQHITSASTALQKLQVPTDPALSPAARDLPGARLPLPCTVRSGRQSSPARESAINACDLPPPSTQHRAISLLPGPCPNGIYSS